jgi:hypothetical protein
MGAVVGERLKTFSGAQEQEAGYMQSSIIDVYSCGDLHEVVVGRLCVVDLFYGCGYHVCARLWCRSVSPAWPVPAPKPTPP